MSDPDIFRRLAALEIGVANLQGHEHGGSGTAFPTGIATGFLFFRTDLGWWCYYDGTQWLTEDEFVQTTTMATFAATNNSALDQLFPAEFAVFITRVAYTTSVAVTNNATNFWTITTAGVNLGKSAGTTIFSFTTAGDTVGVDTQRDTSAVTEDTPANRRYWRTAVTTTLAPGSITIHAQIRYRLIVT